MSDSAKAPGDFIYRLLITGGFKKVRDDMVIVDNIRFLVVHGYLRPEKGKPASSTVLDVRISYQSCKCFFRLTVILPIRTALSTFCLTHLTHLFYRVIPNRYTGSPTTKWYM